mgnify:FL=1
MEQSGIELARREADDGKATARSEVKRSGIELARRDADDGRATARSEMEQSGIELAWRDADDRRATARSGKLSLSENPLIWYSISSEVYHELYLYCHLPRRQSLYRLDK